MSLALVVASLFVAQVDAGVSSGSTLRLEVQGVRNARGHVLVALYRPTDGFTETKSTAFRTNKVAAANGTVAIEFNDLPAGSYALAIFHDENDNERIDTGFFGVPVEGFCFSNDARGLFGPPSFKSAALTHSDQGGKHEVHLSY